MQSEAEAETKKDAIAGKGWKGGWRTGRSESAQVSKRLREGRDWVRGVGGGGIGAVARRFTRECGRVLALPSALRASHPAAEPRPSLWTEELLFSSPSPSPPSTCLRSRHDREVND